MHLSFVFLCYRIKWSDDEFPLIRIPKFIMVAALPMRADLGTMVGAGMTPRRERSTHKQVTPLILEEILSQGNRDAGKTHKPPWNFEDKFFWTP